MESIEAKSSCLYLINMSLTLTLSLKLRSSEEKVNVKSLSFSVKYANRLLVISKVGEVRFSSDIMNTELNTNNRRTNMDINTVFRLL